MPCQIPRTNGDLAHCSFEGPRPRRIHKRRDWRWSHPWPVRARGQSAPNQNVTAPRGTTPCDAAMAWAKKGSVGGTTEKNMHPATCPAAVGVMLLKQGYELAPVSATSLANPPDVPCSLPTESRRSSQKFLSTPRATALRAQRGTTSSNGFPRCFIPPPPSPSHHLTTLSASPPLSTSCHLRNRKPLSPRSHMISLQGPSCTSNSS